MKKIFRCLIVAQLLIVMLASLPAFQGSLFHEFLFTGKTQVFIDVSEIPEIKARNVLNAVAREYQIDVSKLVVPSRELVQIYTNGYTFYEDLGLVSGEIPTNAEQFLADYASTRPNQSGRLAVMDHNQQIEIYDASKLSHSQLSGSYLLNGTPEAIEAFLSVVNANGGSTEIINVYPETQLWIGIDDSNIVMSILFIYLISIFTLVQYYIRYQKKFSVQQTFGWSHGQLWRHELWTWSKVILTSSVIAAVLGSCYYIIAYGFSRYFLQWLGLFGLVSLGNSLILLAIMSLVMRASIAKKVTIRKINGQKNYTVLMSMQYMMKVGFAVVMVVAMMATLQTLDEIQQLQAQFSKWEQTQNWYQPNFALTVGFEDPQRDEKIYAQNLQLQALYENLTLPNFIFDAQNYRIVDGVVGYEYYPNRPDNPYFDTNHGKVIFVDENYVAYNELRAANGQLVSELIDESIQVMTILVPEFLADDMLALEAAYFEDFYYREVQLPNSFLSEFGLPLRDINQASYHVQMIFMPSDQSYFSYDTQIPDIVDPIIQVYKAGQNVINTQSVLQDWYLYTPSGYDGLVADLSANNLMAAIPSLNAVYDEVGLQVRALQQQQVALLMSVSVLAGINLTMSYYFIQSYTQKNRYRLSIQSVFGYSVWRKNAQLLGLIMSIGVLASGLLVGMGLFNPQSLVIMCAIVMIDFLLFTIVQQHFENQQASNLLKRGQ